MIITISNAIIDTAHSRKENKKIIRYMFTRMYLQQKPYLSLLIVLFPITETNAIIVINILPNFAEDADKQQQLHTDI